MQQHQVSSQELAKAAMFAAALSQEDRSVLRVGLAGGLFLRGMSVVQSESGWIIRHHDGNWAAEVPTKDLVTALLVAWDLILK